jgi:hypothetical protein
VESFTSLHLLHDDGRPASEEQDDILRWCTEALFAGGGDTTVSAMRTFILLMARFPEVQARARDEVLGIVGVGPDRLPAVENIGGGKMPYLEALLREVIRWAPVAPLGLRHRAMEEDVYEGYRIPKGATVIANIWAITHDEELYPSPDNFDPERFLGPRPQADPFKYVFGFGRRVCPGKSRCHASLRFPAPTILTSPYALSGAHFAQVSLLLNMASLLAVFEIRKAKDAQGREIEPVEKWSSGTVTWVLSLSDLRLLTSLGSIDDWNSLTAISCQDPGKP